MADYSQQKVPDLKKLLQERGLVVSGNKADLVARLQEDDKKSGTAAGKCYNASYVKPRCTGANMHNLQPAKMKSIGTKMTTRLQLHQLPLPSQLVAKVKSRTPLPYRIRKSTPTLRRQPI